MAKTPNEEQSHPSYGLLTFSRMNQSIGDTLYGSSVPQRHKIRLEIMESTLVRRLSEDHHQAGKILLSAVLSPAQFADAITIMNPNGTPITIRFVSGDDKPTRPPPPPRDLRKTFQSEHRQSVQTTIDLIDQIISHPRIPAGLRRKAEIAKANLQSSVPFLEQQFQQQMEQTITEAVANIESYATQRERAIGQAGSRLDEVAGLPPADPSLDDL